uniref:Uncharacterized protein n=1 Tax=Anopheles stephensi TaxID=30069 RepID=A0A182YIB8_ANOST
MPVEMEDKFSEDDARNESEQEEDIDPKAHAKLIDGINNLTGSHFIREVTRTEPSLKRTEFGLTKSKEEKVRLGDLVKLFTKSKKHTDVVKQLDKLKKRHPLAQPLEKPVADRIARKAGFERVQKDLDRWQAVVTATKVAPQTVYPLLYGGTTVHDAPPKKLSEYRVKTKLMEELEGLEKEYAGPEGDDEGEGSDDDAPNYELTLEEMREKQRERARQKMRESYEIAKGRRLNKIKSKKYHRLLKKDKLKEQMKKFEELKEKNPEEALRQLDHIEKQRFQERVSLRHKNTGTWAKNLQVRAKYDMEVRRELAEQLAIGRELTAKRMQQGDSSSESDGETEPRWGGKSGANPWTESVGDHEQHANNEANLSGGYRKYWEERNQIEQIKKQLNGEAMNGKTTEEGYNEDGTCLKIKEEKLEDDETEPVLKPKQKGEKKCTKKSKRKVVMASGSWEVEDVDEVQPKTSKKAASKKKAKNKREDNVASVEKMFQEAEELIEDVLTSKLERVRRNMQEDEEKRKGETATDSQNLEAKKGNSTDLSFKQKASLADADEEMVETVEKGASDQSTPALATLNAAQLSNGTSTTDPTVKASAEINLKQVVQMKPKHLLTALPNTIVSGELSEDEDVKDAHRLTIAEAFEDDDIVADFAKEKQDERQKDIPQEIELSLPGWGHWAGAGIKPRKDARKLFKPPPALPRRDDNRDQVIINEDGLKNEKLGKHLVNEVPFPFLTVKDYEASLRAPIGRTFIPETAHATMVQPRVITKLGAVIEPMKKDMLVENRSRLMRVGKRQQNEANDAYNAYVEKNHRRAFGR